jgi:hypothetical protein
VVEKTIRVWECDVCGSPGFHYAVTTPEGLLTLDRCPDHDGPLRALRDLEGAKLGDRPKKNVTKETPLAEIYQKIKK